MHLSKMNLLFMIELHNNLGGLDAEFSQLSLPEEFLHLRLGQSLYRIFHTTFMEPSIKDP
jgi:hypothetical protein